MKNFMQVLGVNLLKPKLVVSLVVMLATLTSGLNAKKMTTYGTKTPEGKSVESETISVTNKTGRPVYAAVYLQKSDDSAAGLFGDIYEIQDEKTEEMLRPKWGIGKRLAGGIDRLMYFSLNKHGLVVDLRPSAVVRQANQFVKVGNREGNEFVIYAIDEEGKPNVMGQKLAGTKKKNFDDNIAKDY